MDLIVTDATGKPVASHASYTLDLAFGSGENDFDLQAKTPRSRREAAS